MRSWHETRAGGGTGPLMRWWMCCIDACQESGAASVEDGMEEEEEAAPDEDNDTAMALHQVIGDQPMARQADRDKALPVLTTRCAWSVCWLSGRGRCHPS